MEGWNLKHRAFFFFHTNSFFSFHANSFTQIKDPRYVYSDTESQIAGGGHAATRQSFFFLWHKFFHTNQSQVCVLGHRWKITVAGGGHAATRQSCCVKSKNWLYYNLWMRSVSQVSGGFQGDATTHGWTWPTKCGWLVCTLASSQTWVPMFVVPYSKLALCQSRKGPKHHGWLVYVIWD